MTPNSGFQSGAVLQRGPDGSAQVQFGDGELLTLPSGGPHRAGPVDDVLVGDLWILAGQSNMEGSGRFPAAEGGTSWVRCFGSDERWAVAEEPLHQLELSPRPVYREIWRAHGETRPPADQRIQGTGLGLAFGKALSGHLGVPVGLIPCAQGGTTLEQWDPAGRDDPQHSLYGAMLSRVQACGGRVAGLLWYQGESEAVHGGWPTYEERTEALFAALRADLHAPELPIVMVQLGRHVIDERAGLVDGWNGVREAQRRLAARLPGVRLVTAIDLDLDDHVHVSTSGLKRLGVRLADAVLGHSAPVLEEVQWIQGPNVREADPHGRQLRLMFSQVQGSLTAAGRPLGFSLRDRSGTALHRIYHVALSAQSVTLHLSADLLPGETALWYGWGLDPVCTVTDERHQGLPTFGPVPLPNLQEES
jgi:Carbohydrate esterase, sialic acid-specific acetylesterase